MLTKLFIPVVKIIEESSMNSSNFTNKTNFSDDEVQRMIEQEEINRARYDGFASLRQNRPYRNEKIIATSEAFLNEYDYDYQECEALVLNGEKKDMKEEELVEMTKEPQIAIIILNINPNSLTQESESELRYWIEESKRVLYDTEMPDDIKIKSLPFIDFNMETEGGTKVKLNECKFVKDYTTKEYKYYFAVLVYGVNAI